MPKVSQAKQREALLAETERAEAEAAHATATREAGMKMEAAAAAFISAWDTFSGLIGVEMARQGFNAQKSFPTDIALMHSELSEALEADRKALMDDKLPTYEGRAVELADCVIRILHAQDKHALDSIGALVVMKSLYNLSRPYKHGKEY